MTATQQTDIRQFVNRLRTEDGGPLSLTDVMTLAEAMAGSMQTFFQVLDASIYEEFRDIAGHISAAKAEIGKLQANDLSSDKIPTAGKELDAVVEATENATHEIMEAAEAIMEADISDASAYQQTVNDNIMRIFEACSFQDITGQRIQKVVETLEHIDDRVSRFADAIGATDSLDQLSAKEAKREKRSQDLLLNGPQMPGQGVNQNDVDALMGNVNGASQSDIDALFD